MKSQKSHVFPRVALAVAIIPLVSPLTGQVTAVEFGGDYNEGNSNADKSGFTLENGDFDGEADSDDRRGFIAFGTLFKNINDANGVGNNNVIYHGTQLTHLDGTGADPALGIFRFEDDWGSGQPDALQCGHGGTTAVTQQTFAPHVIKSDFLNGADSNSDTLAFEDAAGSVTVSIGTKSGAGTVNRALVKSGGSWYVSSTSSGSTTDLSINGFTETWFPYDPDSNIYLSATTLSGVAVAGSTLTDIQAFGAVIQQNNIASGRGGNDDRFSVDGFSARMVSTPTSKAVFFAGDYATGNSTSGAIPSQTLETGDFDGEADADDRRAYTTFGAAYPGRPDNSGPDDGTVDNTSFKHGFQVTYFDFTTADPARGVYRYFGNNAGQDSLQTSHGAVDPGSDLVLTFTPYVEKADFLNGFDSIFGLTFKNTGGSIEMDAVKQGGGADFTFHAMVQSGGNWYISDTSSTPGNLLSINGFTETWYPYDPATNLILPSTASGGVLGSTLTNIQAVGMACENTIPAGSAGNLSIFRPQGMTALLEAAPLPPSDPVTVLGEQQWAAAGDLTSHTNSFTVISDPNAKLVVVVGGELGASKVDTVTYGGVGLTKAVGGNDRDIDIWYLDDPAPGAADLVVNLLGAQDPRIAALSLGNAADGVSVVSDPTLVGGGGTPDIDVILTTVEQDTLLVCATSTNNNITTDSTPYVVPDDRFMNGSSGSSISQAGYVQVPIPTTATYSWTYSGGGSGVDAVIAGFASAGEAPAPDDLNDWDAPLASSTPTIDGTLGAGEWSDAFALPMVWPDLGNFPNVGGISSGTPPTDAADLSATLYYKWDSTYLYFAIDVMDDSFIAPAAGGAGFPDDHILLGFDPDTTTDGPNSVFLCEFFVNDLGSGEAFYRTDNPGGIVDSALNVFTNHTIAGDTDAEGYNIEIRFKWTDLVNDGGYIPTIGDTFGTAVLLCDNDVDDGTRDILLYSAGQGDANVMTTPSLWHEATLAAAAGGNDYSDWIGGFPGVGGMTGLDDDPDGDGNDNGVENFFGTAPDQFSQGLIAGALNSGTNVFTFSHPVNANPADDLTATYRWTTDLVNFFNDGDPNTGGTTTVTFTPGTPSGGQVTVEAAITGSVIPSRLFVDVEVTQP